MINNSLARVISYVFHPLFMPTYGMGMIYLLGKVPGFNIYSSDLDQEVAKFTLLSVFIATGVLPVLVALVLKKLKVVSSLTMPKKEERFLPFLLTGIMYLTLFCLLRFYWILPLDVVIFQIMLGATLATFIGMVITFSWKISVHMIGVGGVVGITTVVSKVTDEVMLLPLIVSIICAGLVGFGRLQLKAHTLEQVVAGFFLGFFSEAMIVL